MRAPRLPVLALALAAAYAPGQARAQSATSVTVSAGTPLATIPAGAFGLNTAVWDGNLLDAAVAPALSAAGIGALRYPGGSTADIYNWQTNTIVAGQNSYANPANTFDAFIGLAAKLGAAPVVTVNYGTSPTGGGGTPAFAAAWVRYANVTHGYGVKYWEIGNEVYGNGEYGSSWETDLHPAHDPSTYGANVAQFAQAMKAVDPTIKVGAVLAAPGNWPDGQSPDWNSGVLAQCGSSIDFVVVHWYAQNPGNETDAGLLASPQSGVGGTPSIAAMTAKLRTLIAQYGGTKAASIRILVTETNSVAYNPGKQTLSTVNALFAADTLLTWVENGAANVDLWDLHNGSTYGNTSSALYGSTNYGDYGVLSNASSGEPAADTPFPTYYGLQMLAALGRPGDALVSSASGTPLLATHAVLQANGSLAVLLVNKDPANTITASVAVSGFTPGGTGTMYAYGRSGGAIATTGLSGLGSSFPIVAAPYSLTTVVLAPRTATSPTPTPTPTPTPSPSFTLAAAARSLSVAQGATTGTPVAVTPQAGFSGSVAFAVSGVPAGVAASFSPTSSATGTALSFAAGASAPAGTSVMTVTGTSGALSANTTLTLAVTAAAPPPVASGGGGPASFAGASPSNGPWFDEDDVTLSTTAPVTALTLTITVPATNVSYSGIYQTVGAQIAQTHAGSASIAYGFTLAGGQTISPGSYTFAAQMQGNGTAHPASGDSWSVTYTTGGATYTQSGRI